MICNTCGEKVREEAVACPNCGFPPTDKKHEVKVVEEAKDDKKDSKKEVVYKPLEDGQLAVLWGFIGYFIPIVGLILFIVWKQDKPKNSKAAGIGALIRVILMAIVLTFVIIMGILSK